jgi:predicted transport protein
VLEHNSRLKANLTKEDVDWTQSRVLFVSPYFNKYQRRAINFKDLPMELWEVHTYDNGTLLYNQVESPETVASIGSVTQGSDVVSTVSREVKVFTEDDLRYDSPEVDELYGNLKSKILELGDDIKIRVTSAYVSFKRRTNFADVEFQKSRIKVHINAAWGELDDPNKIARNMTDLGHFGMGDYEVAVSTASDVEKVMYLIKQSYDKN